MQEKHHSKEEGKEDGTEWCESRPRCQCSSEPKPIKELGVKTLTQTLTQTPLCFLFTTSVLKENVLFPFNINLYSNFLCSCWAEGGTEGREGRKGDAAEVPQDGRGEGG